MEIELPKRKPTRLKHFDYSANGSYFITICTQHRKNILSKIAVGEGFPLPRMSQYGEIVDKWILEIPKQYQDISVECYVIMPNHIHLLLSVIKENGRGAPSPTVGSAMGWFKYHATKEINQLRNTVGEKIFQRSFYDHIVRNCDDYREIYKYIHENPKRWLDDCFFTEE